LIYFAEVFKQKVKSSFILYSQQNLHIHRLYQKMQRKIKIFKSEEYEELFISEQKKPHNFFFLEKQKTIAPNMRT